jgi:hypothetical protein
MSKYSYEKNQKLVLELSNTECLSNKETEEDFLAEVQLLPMENAY